MANDICIGIQYFSDVPRGDDETFRYDFIGVVFFVVQSSSSLSTSFSRTTSRAFPSLRLFDFITNATAPSPAVQRVTASEGKKSPMVQRADKSKPPTGQGTLYY